MGPSARGAALAILSGVIRLCDLLGGIRDTCTQAGSHASAGLDTRRRHAPGCRDGESTAPVHSIYEWYASQVGLYRGVFCSRVARPHRDSRSAEIGTLVVTADGSGSFQFTGWQDPGSVIISGRVTWTCVEQTRPF